MPKIKYTTTSKAADEAAKELINILYRQIAGVMPTAQQIRDTVPLKSRFCPLHAKRKPSDRGRKALQSLGFSMVAGGGLEPPTSGL